MRGTPNRLGLEHHEGWFHTEFPSELPGQLRAHDKPDGFGARGIPKCYV